MRKQIALIQPIVIHYREAFFKLLRNEFETDIYCYNINKLEQENFKEANTPILKVRNFQKGPVLLYNPFALLKSKYDVLVLMLHFGHLTTWLLLLTKLLHRKKIILWGQGISVKRYLREEKKPDWKLKFMIKLSDGAWIYTEKEATIWENIFPEKQIVGLNNTLECLGKPDKSRVEEYKGKYGITQKRILLFSARFENPYRRTDLLVDVIEKLNSKEYGFIIIGAGYLKPDFSKYKNVYDFGKLYDEKIKGELFSIADIYFQPGWIGLSVVEAMAYSLPVFSFRRTEDVKQCVEYAYIKEGINGCLFDNLEQCILSIQTLADEEIVSLGQNANKFFKESLSVKNMLDNAVKVLDKL